MDFACRNTFISLEKIAREMIDGPHATIYRCKERPCWELSAGAGAAHHAVLLKLLHLLQPLWGWLF